MASTKQAYPDHTFEDAMRDAGIPVLVLWEMRGPKRTQISWIVGYMVGAEIVMVQTFKAGIGWAVFYTPSESRDVEAIVADAIKRCAPRRLTA